jgi:hypothetical protein
MPQWPACAGRDAALEIALAILRERVPQPR